MSEPSDEEMMRAAAALVPFVRRWNLSLNPEDLDELAFAVLLHSRSSMPLDEIPAAVERQIDEHEQAQRGMYAGRSAGSSVPDQAVHRDRPGVTGSGPVAGQRQADVDKR